MASTRKSRSVNKRYAKFEEEYPDNGGPSTNKNKTRKRKISDMLGPQWSKEELERFYEAFRTHGREWRKVAGSLRHRSIEMVESLYNMNKAYLSLPEGTATAAGLIAMMTDHYNVMEGSDSEHESNDGPRTSRKPYKRARGKYRIMSKGSDGPFPDLLQSHPATSNHGCLSFLKRKHSGGSMPRVVGKRTPRIHVSNTSKSEPGDEGAHVAALTLAEASQQVSSPQVSKTPGRGGENLRCKEVDSEMADSKTVGVMDNDYPEGSLGSREAENGDFTKDCASTYETRQKGKKVLDRKPVSVVNEKDHSDDDREACSGTEEGSSKKIKDKMADDESTSFDALHALADLSFRILPSTAESESSFQAKEERRNIDYGENLNVHESAPTNHFSDRPKVSESIDRIHSTGAEGDFVRKSLRSTKGIAAHDTNSSLEIYTNKGYKRRRKVPLKLKDDIDANSQGIDGIKTEAPMEEGKRIASKPKRFIQNSPPRKPSKATKLQELMSSSPDQGKNMKDVKEPKFQLLTTGQSNLPISKRTKRKMILKTVFSELKHTDNLIDNLKNKGINDSKERPHHCLSSRNFRRWCFCEWFYSAIDYPWFAKTEFVEYLNHVKLGHVPRLTRVEWGVIRSSLGKPRRLSQKFLEEEREKLEQYRESVRAHYAELRVGTKEGLPTDLARPLSVGQRVSACHPKSREIHDGSILTVDHSRCRVQFDRPELGVEFIWDAECMPLNPLENMPEALRKQNAGIYRYYNTLLDIKLEPKDWKINISKSSTPNESSGAADMFSYLAFPDYQMDILMTKANGDTVDAITEAKTVANDVVVSAQQAIHSQPVSIAQIHAREADIVAVAQLACVLDKKEALLIEVTHLNEEFSRNQKEGWGQHSDLENFRKQYAMVLIQLREANEQVATSLIHVRERNTYPGSSIPPWQNHVENFNGTATNQACFSSSSVLSQDSGSNVIEIVDSSKQIATPIVEIAIQAIRSVKEGEDEFIKIGEALGLSNKTSTFRPFPIDSINEISTEQHYTAGKSEAAGGTIYDEMQFPLDLIINCVASVSMIQNCAERQQFPPAEVAQVIDSALASLRPLATQNMPVYREIEICMGIIKNQMLALIPTTANSETSIA